MSTYNGSFPSAAACGCTAEWSWSPTRKSYWSAGGIVYDANQTSGTCAHRSVFQRPGTHFRMQGRREEGWLPGKGPERWPSKDPSEFYMSVRAEAGKRPAPPELVIEYTMTDETPRPDEDVLATPIDQKWYATPLVNPGQIAHARVSGDGRLLTFLADLAAHPYSGYVRVSVLNRNGDVLTSHHCTECGAGEGELHRGGEECPGLQKMRRAAGMAHEPLDPTASAIAHVKETRLRPYKSELAVVMVDDMSEPP